MIQDIFPHRFNNQYLSKKTIEENDYIFHYKEDSLLLKVCDNVLSLPQKKDFQDILKDTQTIFLFTLDDISCFLVLGNITTDAPSLIYKEINFFRTTLQKEIAWVSVAGFHLKNWYLQNKFCGSCGSKTLPKQDERAIVCPNCNATEYPKISPAIIVAIVCNEKILLARNVNFPANWFSLVAGYADIGESLEDTVVREVKEEVGVDVKNVRYYKSQPWPLSGSMMIGFVAEADENQEICIDHKEISEAAWFTKGNLPSHPLNISIAGEMIEKFERNEL